MPLSLVNIILQVKMIKVSKMSSEWPAILLHGSSLPTKALNGRNMSFAALIYFYVVLLRKCDCNMEEEWKVWRRKARWELL